jgi:hypothetical protein
MTIFKHSVDVYVVLNLFSASADSPEENSISLDIKCFLKSIGKFVENVVDTYSICIQKFPYYVIPACPESFFGRIADKPQ